MLSRTAAELYWLSRYLERAENTARMLDVAWNMSLIPFSVTARDELSTPLAISGAKELYMERYGTLQVHNVLHFLTLDRDNPGSIFNSLRMARENAHAVRGKITSEMWESINTTWIELQEMSRAGLLSIGVSAFFDWVKQRSHLFRGAAYGTIMRNDAFRFLRIGTFIERADNTARILGGREQVDGSPGNTAVEFYRWNALLRSVGAFEAYREIYSDALQFENIVELLILRGEVPRSLRSCVEMLCELLPAIEGNAGLNAKRQVTVLFARLQYGDMRHIMDVGVNDYLDDFLRRINDLANTLGQEYLEVV
ncbi:alpha-E domain-containing protein [Alcanivorax sp. 1008]|uniref:alpha-E domain-containing protein n=1 Tax=Alcanivorax sp. 1008 TaxID=2816853 RepID=UPI001D942DB4|nr:alpha-E domain-containing protein [Alcanivorax sp. 1008]MCC1497604.1 alpha-E domain-containing protein [Alcanivorax sp. 1008]